MNLENKCETTLFNKILIVCAVEVTLIYRNSSISVSLTSFFYSNEESLFLY